MCTAFVAAIVESLLTTFANFPRFDAAARRTIGVSSWHSALNCVRSCNLTAASSNLAYATGNKLNVRHSVSTAVGMPSSKSAR